MDISLSPVKPGQICKVISPIPDMEPGEVFIITEDPADFGPEEDILVVSLTELQRKIRHPENAERIAVQKSELVVVGDDLESYVQSWNNKE